MRFGYSFFALGAHPTDGASDGGQATKDLLESQWIELLRKRDIAFTGVLAGLHLGLHHTGHIPHRPVHTGARFSRYASCPSAESSVSASSPIWLSAKLIDSSNAMVSIAFMA